TGGNGAHRPAPGRAVSDPSTEPGRDSPAVRVRGQANADPERNGNRGLSHRGSRPVRKHSHSLFDDQDLGGCVLGQPRRADTGPGGPPGSPAPFSPADGGLHHHPGGGQPGLRGGRRSSLRPGRERRPGPDGSLLLCTGGAGAMRRFLFTLAWLTLVWVALWEEFTWANLIGGVLAGSVVLWAVPLHPVRSSHSLRPLG